MKMPYYIGRLWDKDVLDILKNNHAFSIDQPGADHDFMENGIPSNITGTPAFKYIVNLIGGEIIIFLGCKNFRLDNGSSTAQLVFGVGRVDDQIQYIFQQLE